MPRLSFTSSDNVVRVTPRAAAASVMLKPKGRMHWRSTKPPGCGGFFIGMVLSSFSGNRHNQRPVRRRPQAENHPPVGAYRDRPKTFQLALERMKLEAGTSISAGVPAASRRTRMSRTFCRCSGLMPRGSPSS
jgi:hypothetical protein